MDLEGFFRDFDVLYIMIKAIRVFVGLGFFRLSLVAVFFMAIYYYSVGLVPDLAMGVSTLWLISFFAVPVLVVGKTLQIAIVKIGVDNRPEGRILKNMAISIVLFFLVGMLQGTLVTLGSWTRIILHGGSGRVRESMVHMFEQYPVDQHDFVRVEKQIVQNSINWATWPSMGSVTVSSDSITVFPRFPHPMSGGLYHVMKNSYDRPETGPYNTVCHDFGNGVWLVIDDY